MASKKTSANVSASTMTRMQELGSAWVFKRAIQDNAAVGWKSWESLRNDKVTFDENRLNLQDQRNESVQTYRDLIKNSESTPWEAILIVKSKCFAQNEKVSATNGEIEMLRTKSLSHAPAGG